MLLAGCLFARASSPIDSRRQGDFSAGKPCQYVHEAHWGQTANRTNSPCHCESCWRQVARARPWGQASFCIRCFLALRVFRGIQRGTTPSRKCWRRQATPVFLDEAFRACYRIVRYAIAVENPFDAQSCNFCNTSLRFSARPVVSKKQRQAQCRAELHHVTSQSFAHVDLSDAPISAKDLRTTHFPEYSTGARQS